MVMKNQPPSGTHCWIVCGNFLRTGKSTARMIAEAIEETSLGTVIEKCASEQMHHIPDAHYSFRFYHAVGGAQGTDAPYHHGLSMRSKNLERAGKAEFQKPTR